MLLSQISERSVGKGCVKAFFSGAFCFLLKHKKGALGSLEEFERRYFECHLPANLADPLLVLHAFTFLLNNQQALLAAGTKALQRFDGVLSGGSELCSPCLDSRGTDGKTERLVRVLEGVLQVLSGHFQNGGFSSACDELPACSHASRPSTPLQKTSLPALHVRE